MREGQTWEQPRGGVRRHRRPQDVPSTTRSSVTIGEIPGDSGLALHRAGGPRNPLPQAAGVFASSPGIPARRTRTGLGGALLSEVQSGGHGPGTRSSPARWTKGLLGPLPQGGPQVLGSPRKSASCLRGEVATVAAGARTSAARPGRRRGPPPPGRPVRPRRETRPT